MQTSQAGESIQVGALPSRAVLFVHSGKVDAQCIVHMYQVHFRVFMYQVYFTVHAEISALKQLLPLMDRVVPPLSK